MANTPIGKVIIEAHVNRPYDFLGRVLYTASNAVVDDMKRGNDDGHVQKVYYVSILDVDLGLGSDYLCKGVTDCQGIHTHATLH